MCDVCETRICMLFDELVAGYYRDFPNEQPRNTAFDTDVRRSKYVSLEIGTRAEADETLNRFKDMVEAAVGIGYDPGEFMNRLGEMSGYGDWVRDWARNNKIPNGLVRKIILTCAEKLIRENGAAPRLSFAQAA